MNKKQNLTIGDNDELTIEAGTRLELQYLSSNLNDMTAVYEVYKLDAERRIAMFGKVGKNGKLLKVSPINMLNVSFDDLEYGYSLGNVKKVN